MDFKESINNTSEESMTIWVLGILCVVAMLIMGTEAKEIVCTIGGGLVGYLARGNPASKE